MSRECTKPRFIVARYSLQRLPTGDISTGRALEVGRGRMSSVQCMIFGSILAQGEALCYFGPIFGDDRLNKCEQVVHAQILVRKVLSMADIQLALWGIAAVSRTHRVPMLGEDGAGSTPPSKAGPLPPYPSVQGKVLRRVDSRHCMDSLTSKNGKYTRIIDDGLG